MAQGFEGIASNQPRLRTKMRGYLTRGRVGSFRTIVASGCFVCTRNDFLIQIVVLRRREATFRGNWAAPVVGAVVVAVVGPVVGPVVGRRPGAVVGLVVGLSDLCRNCLVHSTARVRSINKTETAISFSGHYFYSMRT